MGRVEREKEIGKMVKRICEFASGEINKVVSDKSQRKKQNVYA